MSVAQNSPSLPASAPASDRVAIYADAMVRATAGLLLVPHGAQKLFGWFGGAGLDGAQQMFASKMGLPPVMAIVAGSIEFFGGLMLALGLATRLVALLIAGMMAFIVFVVHWPAGFFAMRGGFEYPLLWGVVALSYALRGGGHCSLDAVVGRLRRS